MASRPGGSRCKRRSPSRLNPSSHPPHVQVPRGKKGGTGMSAPPLQASACRLNACCFLPPSHPPPPAPPAPSTCVQSATSPAKWFAVRLLLAWAGHALARHDCFGVTLVASRVLLHACRLCLPTGSSSVLLTPLRHPPVDGARRRCQLCHSIVLQETSS